MSGYIGLNSIAEKAYEKKSDRCVCIVLSGSMMGSNRILQILFVDQTFDYPRQIPHFGTAFHILSSS